MVESVPTNITTILCGNPGGGKSTLLNSFLGRIAFKSGLSLGKGLTTALQTESDTEGNIWADTPGLDDIETRERAAQEITKGLKLGGVYRIVFVVLLDAGRIRPQDKVTMGLIISACELKTNEYGIIINKVKQTTKEKIDNSSTEQTRLFIMLTEGLAATTEYIYINPKSEDLEDENDVLAPVDSGLSTFLSCVPIKTLDPGQVKDIKADKYEEKLKEMSEQLKALIANNDLLQSKFNALRQQLIDAEKKATDAKNQLDETKKINQDLRAKVEIANEKKKSKWKKKGGGGGGGDGGCKLF